MGEGTGAVLRTWSRSLLFHAAWIALVVDLAVQAFTGTSSKPTPVYWSTFAQIQASWIVGLAWGGHLHTHVLRSGSRLVPGRNALHVRVSSLLSLFFLLLPAAACAVAGGSPSAVLLATAGPAAIGFFAGVANQESTKFQTLVFVLILLLMLQGLAASAQESVNRGLLHLPNGVHVDLFLLGTLSTLGGLLLLATSLVLVLRAGEDSWWYRHVRPSTRRRNGTSCDESGETKWLAAVLPSFARRSIQRHPTSTPLPLSGLVRQWRCTAGPVNTIGYLFLLIPLVLLFVVVGHDPTDPTDQLFIPVLFMTNGLSSIGSLYNRRRLAREALRPATRDQLIKGFAGALALDFGLYALLVWLTSLAGYAFVDPTLFERPAFVGTMILAPAACVLGFAVALLGLYLGKYGGILGFFVSFMPTVMIGAVLENEGVENFGTWVGVAVGFVVLGVALLPLAGRLWRDVELGQA